MEEERPFFGVDRDRRLKEEGRFEEEKEKFLERVEFDKLMGSVLTCDPKRFSPEQRKRLREAVSALLNKLQED